MNKSQLFLQAEHVCAGFMIPPSWKRGAIAFFGTGFKLGNIYYFLLFFLFRFVRFNLRWQ